MPSCSHPSSLTNRPFITIVHAPRTVAEAGRFTTTTTTAAAARSIVRPLLLAQAQGGEVQQQQRRRMSDNLLGHSPMAQRTPVAKSKSAGPIVGVDSNTAGGGVWAQTSAKRDKLGELRVELPDDKRTLDDVATPEQRLDLHLADGLALVARSADGAWTSQAERTPAEGEEEEEGTASAAAPQQQQTHPVLVLVPVLVRLDTFLSDAESSRGPDATLARERYDAYLSEVVRILTPDAGAASPSDRITPYGAIAQLRDFVEHDPDPAVHGDGGAEEDDSSTSSATSASASASASSSSVVPPDVDADLSQAEVPFDQCTAYLRILLARAAASHLRDSWEDLTRVTDADVDRAAVGGDIVDPPSELSLRRVNAVLRSYGTGTCRDRVAALWDLVDRDDDGLIDEVEMDYLCRWSMKPVEEALRDLFREAVEVVPARDPVNVEDVRRANGSVGGALGGEGGAKKGWRQRRAEAKAKKRLIKLFDKTISNHFEVEVETPHRLRCIYAWADKAHQDDKVESVLVEAGTIAGRKRYVELSPKISFEEFRSVQAEHFPHLDRVGEEILSSFREDLLVDQGKGRQNKELRRDVALFVGGVSLIDAGILML